MDENLMNGLLQNFMQLEQKNKSETQKMDYKRLLRMVNFKKGVTQDDEQIDDSMLGPSMLLGVNTNQQIDQQTLDDKRNQIIKKDQDRIKELNIENKEVESIMIHQFNSENRFPPKLKVCRNHEMAMKIGMDDINDISVCQCCGYQIKQTPYDLNCHIHSLSEYGVGLCQFFYFIRFSIAITFVICLVYIYSLYTNMQGKYCEYLHEQFKNDNNNLFPSSCLYLQTTIMNIIDPNNKGYQSKSDYMKYVNLISFIVIILGLIFYRGFNRTLVKTIDAETISPSDYTVILKRVNPNIDQNELLTFIEEFINLKLKLNKVNGSQTDYFINKIMFTYRIDEFMMDNDDLQTELKSRLIEETRRYRDGSYSDKFDVELSNRNIKGAYERVKFDIQKVNMKKTQVVFLTFNYQQHAEQFIKRFKSYKRRFNLSEKFSFITKYFRSDESLLNQRIYYEFMKVNAVVADEPEDIQFQNIGVSRLEKVRNRRNTIFRTSLLLLIVFGLLLLCSYLQSLISERKDLKGKMVLAKYAINQILSCFIISINTVLFWEIQKYTRIEKRKSKSKYLSMIISKLSISMFINTAMIMWIINSVILGKVVYEKGSLIEDMTIILWTNSLSSPILNVLSIWHAQRLFKRRVIAGLDDKSYMTQKEANYWFEGSPIDLSFKYSVIIKNIWLSCLYTSLIPTAMYILLIGLVLTYWTEKYLVLRRYKRPERLNQKLHSISIEYIEFAPLLLSIGNIFSQYMIQDLENISRIHIAIIIVGLFNMILPMQKIINYLSSVVYKVKVRNHISYDKASLQFNTDYDRYNPLTENQANRKWLENLLVATRTQSSEFTNITKNLVNIAKQMGRRQKFHTFQEEHSKDSNEYIIYQCSDSIQDEIREFQMQIKEQEMKDGI